MKFVKGQWYTDGENYYQHCSNQQGIDFFRQAGVKDEEMWLTDEQLAKLTPATITPDFSNAKVGDECFSVEEGICKIMDSKSDSLIAAMNKSGGWDAFTMNGKLEPESTHPLLFNSFAQFMAYWAEWKLKGGKDA